MVEILKSCPFEEPVGKYEIESDKQQTNEEWFCSLSTEEKAEWLAGKINSKKRWAEWLKQTHTNQE